MRNKSNISKRLYICFAVLATAVICFTASSLLFAKDTVSARIQSYGSGASASGETVADVDINGGAKIINDEYIFEPGMRVSKDYYIINNDTRPVYYGFNNISGKLAKYIIITVKSGENTLYNGLASELADFNLDRAFVIDAGDREDFTIVFEYPADSGNVSQNADFNFCVCCDYAD